MPPRKKNAQHTPASKIPVPKRKQTTGNSNSHTANSKSSKLDKVPQTDEEKRMDYLRSKLENSMSAFIKARKELEEVLSAGGSSEQGRPLENAAAELRSELRRHRTLTLEVDTLIKENRLPTKPFQDPIVPTNSYEFLKSIMG